MDATQKKAFVFNAPEKYDMLKEITTVAKSEPLREKLIDRSKEKGFGEGAP
jgi:hypothetical protein